jgi:hypothetical protein
MQTTLLAHKIPPRLPLMLILYHTSTNHNSFLSLVLHQPTQTNDFLSEIPRFLVIMSIRRDQLVMIRWVAGRAMAGTTGITRPFVRLTVNFQLDLFRSETSFATATFHALGALANAGAEPATEVCAVSGAPGPDSTVCGVVAA